MENEGDDNDLDIGNSGDIEGAESGTDEDSDASTDLEEMIVQISKSKRPKENQCQPTDAANGGTLFMGDEPFGVKKGQKKVAGKFRPVNFVKPIKGNSKTKWPRGQRNNGNVSIEEQFALSARNIPFGIEQDQKKAAEKFRPLNFVKSTEGNSETKRSCGQRNNGNATMEEKSALGARNMSFGIKQDQQKATENSGPIIGNSENRWYPRERNNGSAIVEVQSTFDGRNVPLGNEQDQKKTAENSGPLNFVKPVNSNSQKELFCGQRNDGLSVSEPSSLSTSSCKMRQKAKRIYAAVPPPYILTAPKAPTAPLSRKERKMNRELFTEGTIRPRTAAAKTLSRDDHALRRKFEDMRWKDLLSNKQTFVSPTQLVFHDLPRKVDDNQLRKVIEQYVSDAEITRVETPTPRLRIVTFTVHEHALEALRKLNNRQGVFTRNHKPIVYFYIVNGRIRGPKNKVELSAEERSLHLADEGLIQPGSKEAEGVSEEDLNRRQERHRKNMRSLERRPFRSVSPTTLLIHNLPLTLPPSQLKESILKALDWECREDALAWSGTTNVAGESIGPNIRLSFTEHEHALKALRKLNNNPDIFSPENRPIVEFALRNGVLKKKECLNPMEPTVKRKSKRFHSKPKKRLKLPDDSLTTTFKQGKSSTQVLMPKNVSRKNRREMNTKRLPSRRSQREMGKRTAMQKADTCNTGKSAMGSTVQTDTVRKNRREKNTRRLQRRRDQRGMGQQTPGQKGDTCNTGESAMESTVENEVARKDFSSQELPVESNSSGNVEESLPTFSGFHDQVRTEKMPLQKLSRKQRKEANKMKNAIARKDSSSQELPVASKPSGNVVESLPTFSGFPDQVKIEKMPMHTLSRRQLIEADKMENEVARKDSSSQEFPVESNSSGNMEESLPTFSGLHGQVEIEIMPLQKSTRRQRIEANRVRWAAKRKDHFKRKFQRRREKLEAKKEMRQLRKQIAMQKTDNTGESAMESIIKLKRLQSKMNLKEKKKPHFNKGRKCNRRKTLEESKLYGKKPLNQLKLLYRRSFVKSKQQEPALQEPKLYVKKPLKQLKAAYPRSFVKSKRQEPASDSQRGQYDCFSFWS